MTDQALPAPFEASRPDAAPLLPSAPLLSSSPVPPSAGVNGGPAAEVPATEQARAYARASKADNTRRAYAAQLKLWVAFAERQGIASFPADPLAVANWLAERAGAGQAYSTLRTATAAVRAGSAAAGFTFDTRSPAVEHVMAGIGRTEARAQRQAEPLRGPDVAGILGALGDSMLDQRDGALLGLMYVFALRRSEAVAIDLDRHGAGDGFVRIGAATIELTIVRSKTAKAGEVEVVTVPRAEVAGAIAAIERWASAAGIAPSTPLLRSVAKGGKVSPGQLDPQSVATIIKRRVAEHYVRLGSPPDKAAEEAARFSGHSLRVGLAVTAAEHGATADEIATVTRHRSLEMPRRYAAKADKLRRSPFNRRGVGV